MDNTARLIISHSTHTNIEFIKSQSPLFGEQDLSWSTIIFVQIRWHINVRTRGKHVAGV